MKQPPGRDEIMAFTLTSRVFDHGSPIPKAHTCDGADRSPALEWIDVPPGTRALALIVEDPDAPGGTWIHWTVYDLPPGTRSLAEGVPRTAELVGGGKQGINSFHKLGYGGPCPPSGKPHRYFFRLHALDAPTRLDPGQHHDVVARSIQGHVLATAELVGTYGR
jgi:Raf kinase inhibitor-like YbhB/YbcL family protein